jgi:hypothetical protein
MRDPAHVPELQENEPAVLVHRAGHVAPPLDLLVAENTRRVRVTLAVRADDRCFADDQARFVAARVVAGALLGRHQVHARHGAGHRRHHDAIGQLQAAELGGLEDVFAHESPFDARRPREGSPDSGFEP